LSEMLEFLSQRAGKDPFFLGSLLAEFARGERLDDPALAAWLGCAPGVLVRLRLCRAPREEHPGSAEDVAQIARHYAIDEERLGHAVLQAQLLRELKAGTASSRGVLAAARDAEPPDSTEDGEKEA
jgi:hypothetical protein